MIALPLFHRVAGAPVLLIGEGEAAAAKARLIERAGARVVRDIEPAVRLAFVAMPHPEDEAARLKAAGLLVNVVDRPDLCDFTVPAIVDRDPVTIAIGTGGASAGLAKALRQRFERMVPGTLGTLARALQAARPAIIAHWPVAADRRRAIDHAVSEGGLLDPLRSHDGAVADRVAAWIDTTTPQPRRARHRVALHSTDPDDLTLRAARWLGEADVVVHDAAVPSPILDRARADAMRVAATPATRAAEYHGIVVDLFIDG